jgi:hypothetical protein
MVYLVFFLIVITLLIVIYYLRNFVPLRKDDGGFPFVYVDTNGIVRELFDDEKEYLLTDFHPADGARPYIKSRYSEKTPDGKISGYISRNRVPKRIKIN